MAYQIFLRRHGGQKVGASVVIEDRTPNVGEIVTLRLNGKSQTLDVVAVAGSALIEQGRVLDIVLAILLDEHEQSMTPAKARQKPWVDYSL